MAKIIYFCVHDILPGIHSGGELVSSKNVEMLQDIYGVDNVEICIFMNKSVENVPEHVTVFPKIEKMTHSLFSGLLGFRAIYPQHFKKVLQYVDEVAPDIAVFDSTFLGRLIAPLKKRKIFTVAFFQNVEKDFSWNRVVRKSLIYLIPYWVVAFNEKLFCRNCDALIALNKRDERRIYQVYKRKVDFVLPVVFSDVFDESKLSLVELPKKDLLFIGSCFPPNVHGISWFINEVMPLLPGYTLKVVGKGFEEKRSELTRDNVEIIGSVDELAYYYYNYPALVMPILYGNGMKVKTAEAMMYGRTIFATDEALEGYDVEGVCGIYRCNKANEFVESIEKFFQGDSLNFQESVRKIFLEKYETATQLEMLKQILL